MMPWYLAMLACVLSFILGVCCDFWRRFVGIELAGDRSYYAERRELQLERERLLNEREARLK